ncbi:MAG: FHA domain-containing protein [Mycobacteriaceae bacterium]|nr:FHA domain-containing protein [Mycobacteriaceae bacterium]
MGGGEREAGNGKYVKDRADAAAVIATSTAHYEQTPDDAGDMTAAFPAHLVGELDAPAAATVTPHISAVEARPSGAALLVVKRGPNAGSRYPLHQAVTAAGRHPRSDIFLDDITVSRRHAEFRLDNGQFRVEDVGSLNGIYVNRDRVEWSELVNGDEIQIGKFRLLFITAG